MRDNSHGEIFDRNAFEGYSKQNEWDQIHCTWNMFMVGRGALEFQKDVHTWVIAVPILGFMITAKKLLTLRRRDHCRRDCEYHKNSGVLWNELLWNPSASFVSMEVQMKALPALRSHR